MRTSTLSIPEIGLIAATRGMFGAGVALLVADRVPREKRKKIAIPLLLIGLLSTAPLIVDVLRKSHDDAKESEDEQPCK